MCGIQYHLNKNLPVVLTTVLLTFTHPLKLITVCSLCTTIRKSNNYYSRSIKKKACFPNYAQKLKIDFNQSNKKLKRAFLLPHSVASEPYDKAFQFKILNSILFTNSKLFKIGYRTDNLCPFCKQKSETITHLFWDRRYFLNSFWKNFEPYYFVIRQEFPKNLQAADSLSTSPASPFPKEKGLKKL